MLVRRRILVNEFKSWAGLCRGSCQQRAPQTDEHLYSKRLWNNWHSLSCQACSHLTVGLKGVQEQKPEGQYSTVCFVGLFCQCCGPAQICCLPGLFSSFCLLLALFYRGAVTEQPRHSFLFLLTSLLTSEILFVKLFPDPGDTVCSRSPP